MPASWPSDEVRICPQALPLRDHGYRREHAELWYAQTRRRVRAELTPHRLFWAADTVNSLPATRGIGSNRDDVDEGVDADEVVGVAGVEAGGVGVCCNGDDEVHGAGTGLATGQLPRPQPADRSWRPRRRPVAGVEFSLQDGGSSEALGQDLRVAEVLVDLVTVGVPVRVELVGEHLGHLSVGPPGQRGDRHQSDPAG